MLSRYTYNTDVFLKEDFISFYLLGLFITDGNVYLKKNNEFSIKSIDYDLLFSILNLVCPNKKLYKVKTSNCYKLTFHNKIIIDWLLKYGCIPNKTKIVKFPDINPKYLPDLMRGLIDGDGSIALYKNRAMIRFDSASLDLISGFIKVLASWNIDVKINKTPWISTMINGKIVKSTTQMYRVNITGLKAYKLLKIIYNNQICLNRKKIIADQIISFFESKGFNQEELSNFKTLPIKKWIDNDKLVAIVVKHRGVISAAAKELNLVPWTLSSKLRKIGKYNYIRLLFPFNNIKNLKNKRKLFLPKDQIEDILKLINNKISYKEIAKIFNIKTSYVAFIKRRFVKK